MTRAPQSQLEQNEVETEWAELWFEVTSGTLFLLAGTCKRESTKLVKFIDWVHMHISMGKKKVSIYSSKTMVFKLWFRRPASAENLSKMQILILTSDRLSEKPWGRRPAICVLTSPPGISDAHLSLRIPAAGHWLASHPAHFNHLWLGGF